MSTERKVVIKKRGRPIYSGRISRLFYGGESSDEVLIEVPTTSIKGKTPKSNCETAGLNEKKNKDGK